LGTKTTTSDSVGSLKDAYEYQKEDCTGRVGFKTHRTSDQSVEVSVGFKTKVMMYLCNLILLRHSSLSLCFSFLHSYSSLCCSNFGCDNVLKYFTHCDRITFGTGKLPMLKLKSTANARF
jgi:hypothetical protein